MQQQKPLPNIEFLIRMDTHRHTHTKQFVQNNSYTRMYSDVI